jgi:hypothetical protein
MRPLSPLVGPRPVLAGSTRFGYNDAVEAAMETPALASAGPWEGARKALVHW